MNVLRLTLAELAELVDHFEEASRAGTWVKTPTFWVRMLDGEVAMAVQLAYPANAGPFTLGIAQAIAGDLWKDDEANDYLHRLAIHWTGYGQRMDVMKLMVDELKLDEATASAMAIAVASTYNGTSLEPDPPMVQDSLPDVRAERTPTNLTGPLATDRIFQVHGGGWVKILLRGEMFFLETSLPHKDIDGYAHMKGFVRSTNGYGVRTTAEYLFGWQRDGVQPDNTATQQNLEEAS